jgi:hypothetical protein
MRKFILQFFGRTPEILALLVFCYFAFYVLIDLQRDTLILTNSAFAICATLAALSFSFSRAVSNDKKLADRINYAGERFFHSSLFLIIASVLKWAAQSLIQLETVSKIVWLSSTIHILFVIFVCTLFTRAAMDIHGALKTINPILLHRIARVKDWDTFL